jgi:hypothetical protein
LIQRKWENGVHTETKESCIDIFGLVVSEEDFLKIQQIRNKNCPSQDQDEIRNFCRELSKHHSCKSLVKLAQ